MDFGTKRDPSISCASVVKGHRRFTETGKLQQYFSLPFIVIPQCEIYLPLYEKYLKESGSGFLVKSGLTFADFIVSEFLITLRQNAPEVLEKYPEILQFLDRMKNIPQLKEYYATRNDCFIEILKN